MTAPTPRPAPVNSTTPPNPRGTSQPCGKPSAEAALGDEIPTPTTRSRISVQKSPDPVAHEHSVRLNAIEDHILFIQDTYERISGLYAVLAQRLDQLVVKGREASSRCAGLEGTVASLRVDVKRLQGEKMALEAALENASASWTASEATLAKDLAYAQCVLSSERARRREADASVAELHVSVDSSNDTVHRLQDSLHAVHHETKVVQDENAVLRDTLDKLEAAGKQAEGYQRTLEDVFKAYQGDKDARLEDLGRELAEMRAGRDMVSDELRQAEARSMEEIRDLRDTMQAAQATVSMLKESSAVLESRLAVLDGERQEAYREVERSRREAAAAKEKVDATKSEIDALNMERKELADERNVLKSTVGGQEAALAEATEACKALQQSRNTLEEELQRQLQDHAALKVELEALQKSCDAIRAREGQARAEAEAAKAAVRAMETRLEAMEAEAEAFRRTQSATPATTAPAAAAKVAPPAVGQATAAPPGRKRQGGVSASAAQLISKRRARSSQMK